MERIRANERTITEIAVKADASIKTVRDELKHPGAQASRARERIRATLREMGLWRG